MVYIPPELVFSGITTGLNFFGDYTSSQSAYEQQQQQYDMMMRQEIERTMLQNQQIAEQNAYKEYEYEQRQKIAAQQIEFNIQAANDAFVQEQTRLQEYLKGVAFSQEDMSSQLMEAIGTNAAMADGRGRSFELASAKGTTGDYGRAMTRLRESVKDQKSQSQRNMLQIQRQADEANFQAWSSVAIAPFMQSMLPMPTDPGFPGQSGTNTALMIGNSLLSGYDTYMGLAGPDPGSLGSGDEALGSVGSYGRNYSTDTSLLAGW